MIKVGLLGLGKTGKIVAENLIKDKRFDLVFAVKNKLTKPNKFNFTVETKEMLEELINEFKPQMIVDFTTPEAIMRNIRYLQRNTGLVVATTGFKPHQIRSLKQHRDLKILFAPNISSGINTLMKACKEIDTVWPGADIEIVESHFKDKKDAPSGTAIKIANLLNGKIPIHSIRAGGIVGIHKVIFAKNNQKIEIKHESFSREVFAESAKDALIWLANKGRGFYEMRDIYEY